MRSEIIVTVKDSRENFTYDVEIPVSITVRKAVSDIVDVLNAYSGRILLLPEEKHQLKNERTGNILESEKTLYENAVWQGDVLTIL